MWSEVVVSVHTCEQAQASSRTLKHARTHAHTHARTHAHTHTHTHTHTHAHTRTRSPPHAPAQAVVVGQPLLVLESMKMETTLPSPRAGAVRGADALHVGAQIQEGQVLLRIVAEEEAGDTATAAAAAAGAA